MAPHVFRVDDIAVVLGEGDEELLREVAEACPAGAISLVDGETGDQVYP
jgi:hypothetical protein